MKIMQRILAVLCGIVMLTAVSASQADDGFSTSYTYGYDYWEDVQESPDAYRVAAVIDNSTLGRENLENVLMNKAQSLYVRGNTLYVCDTANNRILEITRSKNNEFKLKRIIKEMTGTENNTFASPYDVFVDPAGNIYVADYDHQRVVMMDKNLKWIRDYTKPTDATFDQSQNFLPKKIVVDVAGRVYALCQNINKGLVKFEEDGFFSGFIGANTVSVSMADYIWKRYFQTKEQRAQTANFVPTEYENVYIDDDGFIYATTIVYSEGDLKWDKAKPIRRLNSLGADILIKNDKFPPIGDLQWVSGAESTGPSKMVDVTVLNDDMYVALDKIRGRLFGYDSQGVLLWAFGTKGNVDGAFTGAVSIEHMGHDLLVLDQQKNNITVFEPTEYSNTIFDAIETYLNGEYDRSAELWQDVLKMNANYPLAFRGIGRAVLRQNKYQEAMDWFKLAHDRENYGRAFKLYRKDWVEQNIWWIILIVAVLLIVPLVLGRVKRTKWEVVMHEHSKVRK